MTNAVGSAIGLAAGAAILKLRDGCQEKIPVKDVRTKFGLSRRGAVVPGFNTRLLTRRSRV